MLRVFIFEKRTDQISKCWRETPSRVWCILAQPNKSGASTDKPFGGITSNPRTHVNLKNPIRVHQVDVLRRPFFVRVHEIAKARRVGERLAVIVDGEAG